MADYDLMTGVKKAYEAYSPDNKPTAANIQNVVSPVSSGGIIERGSNANGEYVKFADGTMICTSSAKTVPPLTAAAGAVFRNSTSIGPYTWPVSFITKPFGVTDCGRDSYTGAGLWTSTLPSPTGFYCAVFSTAALSTIPSDIQAVVVAMGRWK